MTLPVRDQPAGPPRKSLTVTVCRAPVEAPPLPKSTAESWTASPAWDIDRDPALTVVVSFWEPAGIGVSSTTTYAAGPAPLVSLQLAPSYATTPVVVLSLTASVPLMEPCASAVVVAVSAVWVAPDRPARVTLAPGVKLLPVTVTLSPGFPEAEPSEMARLLVWVPSVAVIVPETGAGGLVTVQGVSSSRM